MWSELFGRRSSSAPWLQRVFGFAVQDLGFRGLGFRVEFRVKGLGSGFRV